MNDVIYNQFHIAFYAVAFMVSAIIIMQTFIQKRTDKAHNVVFIVMNAIILFNSLTEIIGEIAFPNKQNSAGAVLVDDVCHILYFMIHSLLAPFFFVYMLCLTDAIKRRTDLHSVVFAVPIAIMELLIVTNPFTSFIYYHNAEGEFTRNWAEAIIYLVSAAYIIFSIVNIFRFWYALNTKRKLSAMAFLGCVILGLLIQLLYPDIRCELFAEALGMLGIMLSMENEDEWEEPETGVYNRLALEVDLNTNIKMGNNLDLINLRITDISTSLRSIGLTNIAVLTNEIAEYLKTIIQKSYIYNVDPSQFVLLLENRDKSKDRRWFRWFFHRYEPDKSSDELVELILEKFKGNWTVGKTRLSLNPVILRTSIPERIKTVEEAFFLIDSPVPARLEKQVLEGDDLSYLLRRTDVENAVLRGMNEGDFEVYYQPVYELNTRKLYGAEALLRLHDKQLGNIYPDEFIPVIEQMGLIDEVDDMVLGRVCEFIESGIPSKAGMTTLNVNLSMIQCMQRGFVDRINKIVENYSIDKHMITFEITESVGADDYKKLGEIIDELRASGYQFAMDDYGTGYSNIQSIFSLNFDVIKIDKSILWAADEGEIGMTILTNTINMIKQMKRKIVVEGVETENQIHLLEKLGVDYQQGFYFSKPIPKADFIRDILGE